MAFHVRKSADGKGKGFWTRIGAAWSHEDGEGFNLQIDVMPLDGKIVLGTPKANDACGQHHTTLPLVRPTPILFKIRFTRWRRKQVDPYSQRCGTGS